MNIFHLAHARHEESPRSVLMRTAYANGFGSVSAMARAFGAKESLQPFAWQMRHSKLVGQLASHVHLNGQQFQASFYTQLGRTSESPVDVMGLAVPSANIRADAFSICPECIKAGTHSSILDLSWLHSCPEHDCKLESACPQCLRTIRWTQISGSHCQCGFDLRNTPKTYWHSLSSHCLLKIFRAKDQAALGRFIFALKALRYTKQPNQTQEILETAARVADCDTEIFEELLETSKLLYPCLTLRPLLAPWMASEDSWIKSQVQHLLHSKSDRADAKGTCKCSALQLYQDEMIHALKISQTKLRSFLTRDLVQREKGEDTRWKYSAKKLCMLLEHPTGLLLPTEQPSISETSTQDCSTHLTIEETAIRLGVYPQAIRSAYSRGFMQTGIRKGPHGRSLLQVAAVHHFSENFVFIGQLATDLGLPRTTLSAKLLHLGIVPISGPDLDGGLINVYRREDINDEVQASLQKVVHYKSNAGRKPIGASSLIGEESTSSTDTARALGFVLHDLKHLERQGLITRAKNLKTGRHFTSSSVANAKAQLQNMISLKRFSAQLGMTPQTFSRRFIQSDFLEYLRVGSKTLISIEQIRRVQEHRELFMSFCEADEILGASIGHSANLVRQKRLNPVHPHETGYVSTVRLLRRHDVIEIK
ncbi:TniQ family protein [Pseudomonas migulae]|uniref:TniQ family protein n=1 Tax=Pseudomonas migulae TaxID=78543 RepID=A0ABY8MR81_9PSED|nr:TniQ family protein [Pseudomonas migulae]WGK89283.1 TniQ family protein [Pseudomonas migulae]